MHLNNMKIAFVSAHPAPYRDPFLRRISANPGIETKIFSLFADDNAHSFWNLEKRGYPSELIGERSEHWFRLFIRLVRRVVFGGFDFIIWPGFHRPCVKAAIILCALMGKRYGFCADSIAQPRRVGFAIAIKRFVVRHAKMVFVPGNASKAFFMREFLCPESKICLGQYALEGEEIEHNVLDMRKSRKDEIRHKYGLDNDETVFLMVANMISTRHYPITARAFVKFAEKWQHAKFVMVGKGPELQLIDEMASKYSCLKVIPGVSFLEMQELYAVADVYVHGGTEPASTALVIGAISHLPLISSSAVGCSSDVIKHGSSGALVGNFLSIDEWMLAFDYILMRKESWREMGQLARKLSRSLDCERVVENFISSIINILGDEI